MGHDGRLDSILDSYSTPEIDSPPLNLSHKMARLGGCMLETVGEGRGEREGERAFKPSHRGPLIRLDTGRRKSHQAPPPSSHLKIKFSRPIFSLYSSDVEFIRSCGLSHIDF